MENLIEQKVQLGRCGQSLLSGAPGSEKSVVSLMPEWSKVLFIDEEYFMLPSPIPCPGAGSTRVYNSKDSEANVQQNTSAQAPKDQSLINEDEAYAHLLHDVLMTHGDVSLLQYYISLKTNHSIVVCRVGKKVCGHKGIIHGGFTATLLDNAMGVVAHRVYKRAATKSLHIDYKRPFLADSFVVVDMDIIEQDSRTCTIKAVAFSQIPGCNNNNNTASENKSSNVPNSQIASYREPNIPDGCWIVAIGTGVFADVSRKWDGI